MNTINEKKEKKRGLFFMLSRLFGGGSPAAGGLSSGMGAGGGLGGLFATKAGIVGMVLGGATIAAGVGVVYNFIGPSSKSVYSPELFRNSYYEEESSRAGSERTRSRDASSAASSTLDMFREQAQKDGLGGLAGEAAEDGAAAGQGEAPGAADASADADAAAAAASVSAGMNGMAGAVGAAGAGMPRLQAAAGFGGSGGGAGSGTSRMQSGGALSGGAGALSGSGSPASAKAGKASGMTASARGVKNSSRSAVPNLNKKGAYGQAKYAGDMGARAAYSTDAGARTEATTAFSGETSGSGDVGTPVTGAGLSGAGISDGSSLKGSDPDLNTSSYTPPPAVTAPKGDDPWKKTEDDAMKFILISGGLVLATTVLSKFKSPWTYYAAMATAAAAIGFAAYVLKLGIDMISKYGQTMNGAIYIAAAVMLAIAAWNALCGAAKTTTGAGNNPLGSSFFKDASISLKGLLGTATAATTGGV